MVVKVIYQSRSFDKLQNGAQGEGYIWLLKPSPLQPPFARCPYCRLVVEIGLESDAVVAEEVKQNRTFTIAGPFIQHRKSCRTQLYWRDASNGQIPPRAVACGTDELGRRVYVGRARNAEGLWVPGEVRQSAVVGLRMTQGGFMGPGVKGILNNYQVLVNPNSVSLAWVPFGLRGIQRKS